MRRSIDPIRGTDSESGRNVNPSRIHRFDESPVGYSLASCSPAELASALPTTTDSAQSVDCSKSKIIERSVGSFRCVSPKGSLQFRNRKTQFSQPDETQCFSHTASITSIHSLDHRKMRCATAKPCTVTKDRMTISPAGSLAGLTGKKRAVPSRRERTLLATIARIIQIAARTSGQSTPNQPVYLCFDAFNPVSWRMFSDI